MKPKISVLMNCYNGEAFLREALDSVFNQTFTNWELVFVDNCSTDSSYQILSTYDQSQIKYIKTEENISLGAARNLGVKSCSGEFISFLDCDDIWFPNMLQEQILAINKKEYALVYAGQVNINKCGIEIRRHIPLFKEGNIFSDLLIQYDIPLVTAMIRRSALLESKLNFDPYVYGSEEYCLFLQLSVNYEFAVISKVLVKYRVLNNSLTTKTISVRGKERRYTLDKILSKAPNLKVQFPESFDEAYARSYYYDAQHYMFNGNRREARECLSIIKFKSRVYFLLYILSYMPYSFWKYVQAIKYGR